MDTCWSNHDSTQVNDCSLCKPITDVSPFPSPPIEPRTRFIPEFPTTTKHVKSLLGNQRNGSKNEVNVFNLPI